MDNEELKDLHRRSVELHKFFETFRVNFSRHLDDSKQADLNSAASQMEIVADVIEHKGDVSHALTEMQAGGASAKKVISEIEEVIEKEVEAVESELADLKEDLG